jgi:Domain of unknown function (DUF4160)
MHVHLVGGNINAKIDLSTLQVVAGTIPASLKKEVIDWLSENQITGYQLNTGQLSKTKGYE